MTRRRRSGYEHEFASQLGERVQSFAFWKGRTALYAILRAMDVSSGSEVILPAFTCVAVPNAVRFAGAHAVFADVPERSYNLDISAVERLITPRTRAIVIQHTFGIPCDVRAFLELGESRGACVVEDCAHAFGTSVSGTHVGLTGHAGFFSSQWSKPYSTGLGGVAVTSHPGIAERLADVQGQFRPPSPLSVLQLSLQYSIHRHLFTSRSFWVARAVLHGLSRMGLFVGSSGRGELTGKRPSDHDWLMSAFQERIGLKVLPEARAAWLWKQRLAQFYEAGLASAGWQVSPIPPGAVLLRYPVRVSNKAELLVKARRMRVELGSWFETPLHPIPLGEHRVYGYEVGQCPNAERAARETVNLPLHSRVSRADAERVLDFVLANAERVD